MQTLRYTLLADGSSDRALLPILTWLLRQYCGAIPIQKRESMKDMRRNCFCLLLGRSGVGCRKRGCSLTRLR